MQLSAPKNFITMNQWCAEEGAGLISDPKMLSHHISKHHSRLIELGGLAKVGCRVFLHREQFWVAYQQLQVEQMNQREQKQYA